MATYRCACCKGLYVSPQAGVPFFHACPPEITDYATGAARERPCHRDENVVQVLPGPDAPAETLKRDGPIGQVRMKRRGPGRVKLSDDDRLTGATPAQLAALFAMPGTPEPDP